MAFNVFGKTLESMRDLYYYSRFTHLLLQKNNYTVSKVVHCNDKPIKYSSTKASKITTKDLFKPKPDNAVLPYEHYVVIGSLLTLLVYVMIREENKIDKILSGSFDYKDEDEIKLVNALLHAKLRGLKTDDIEEKLNKLKKNPKV